MKGFFRGGKLNDKFAWEISGLSQYRSFDDGLSIVDFRLSYDNYEADHMPALQFLFALFNFVILEITIYNMHHLPDDEQEVIDDFIRESKYQGEF